MKPSKKYSLSIRDFMHGLIMAVGGAFTDAVINCALVLMQEHKDFDLLAIGKEAAIVGGIAALVYIQKKLFQNSEGKFKGEPKSTLQ